MTLRQSPLDDDIEETDELEIEEKPRNKFFGFIVPIFVGLVIAFLVMSMLKSLRYSVDFTPHPFDGRKLTIEAELSAHLIRPIWWGNPNSMLTVKSAQIEDSQHHIVQAFYQAGNTRQIPVKGTTTIEKYWIIAGLTPERPCDLSHGGRLLVRIALENTSMLGRRPLWEDTYSVDIPASKIPSPTLVAPTPQEE